MAVSTAGGGFQATVLYTARINGADVSTFVLSGPLGNPESLAIVEWLRESEIPFVDCGANPHAASIIILPRDEDDMLTLTLRLPVEIPISNVIIAGPSQPE
jgi:hypothetical protein